MMKEDFSNNARTMQVTLSMVKKLVQISSHHGLLPTVPQLPHVLVMLVKIPSFATLVMTLLELNTHQVITVTLSVPNTDTQDGMTVPKLFAAIQLP